MATYKNGHKRNSNDKFLSYVLIGFAITFFVILISMVLFNTFNESLEVSNLTEMNESEYLVYFYSDTCPACIDIKDEVAAFANNNNAGIKLYYLDSYDVSNTDYQYLSDTYGIGGTPAMLTIVDGVVVDVLSGNIEIPQVFDLINNGIYQYIN